MTAVLELCVLNLPRKMLIVVMALAVSATWSPRHADAQDSIAFVYHGRVTINGEQPEYSGFWITARVRDVWESAPVIVGADPNRPFEYENLWVETPRKLNLYGSEVTFWLNGEVAADATDRNRVELNDPPPPCDPFPWCVGYLPSLRSVDLDFPSLPDPKPLPDDTPTLLRTPPISELGVGGVALPPIFALLAMLAGAVLVTLGMLAYQKSHGVSRRVLGSQCAHYGGRVRRLDS